MRQGRFRHLGTAAMALLALVAILFAVARWLVPTPAQRDALDRMQLSSPPANNGYAAYRYGRHAVPADARETLLQEEADAVRAWVATRDSMDTTPPDSLDLAARRYGPPESPHPSPPNCDMHAGGCLATVRSEREAYARRLTREAAYIERIAALAAFDGLYLPPEMMDVHAATMNLIGGPPNALVTQRAFDFVEGRTEAALAGTCDDVVTWRRLGANTNQLVVNMISNAAVSGLSRLFADMLAELQPGHPLPAACESAFVPMTEKELSMCEVLRGEFAYIRSMLDLYAPARGIEGAIAWLAHDREATDGAVALHLVEACEPAMAQAMLRDEPVHMVPPVQPSWFECLGNVYGCALAGASMTPNYDDYLHRHQDTGAALRLADIVRRVYLAGNDGRQLADRLRDADLAAAHSPRALRAADGGASLSLPLYYTQRAETISVPTAPWLQHSSARQSAGSQPAK